VEGIGRLAYIEVDCADPVAIARFWSQVLGVSVAGTVGDPPHYVGLGSSPAAPNGPMVTFQRVPEPKSVKNRLHLDVNVDDVESATARIEALGGSRARYGDFSEYGYRWRVMADLEGNEFCLVFSSPG